MKLKFCSINFWPDAWDSDFYDYLLKLSIGSDFEWVNSQSEADVVFTSVFGNQISNPENTILISAERPSPLLLRCTFSLSHDVDDWSGKNCYCPYWLTRLAWPDFVPHSDSREPLISIENLTRRRSLSSKLNSKEFCAIFARNPEPLRLNLFGLLSGYRQVDGFGLLFNNYCKDSKFKILRNYKFCLCPENSLSPGYITEKLFDAYASNVIPVYYGPTDVCRFNINPKAIINYSNFECSEDFLEFIKSVDSSESLYRSIYEEPLLLDQPTLERQTKFLKKAISTIIRN